MRQNYEKMEEKVMGLSPQMRLKKKHQRQAYQRQLEAILAKIEEQKEREGEGGTQISVHNLREVGLPSRNMLNLIDEVSTPRARVIATLRVADVNKA